jgi:protein-disulfide isomerase
MRSYPYQISSQRASVFCHSSRGESDPQITQILFRLIILRHLWKKLARLKRPVTCQVEANLRVAYYGLQRGLNKIGAEARKASAPVPMQYGYCEENSIRSPDSSKKKYNAAMLNNPMHSKRSPISPLVYMFIPLAFFLGLGGGYLLWGSTKTSAAADAAPIRRVDVSTDDDPSIGPADAPVTIIEFSDYQCPYCQVWYKQVYQQLLASYPNKIRFVYRDLPLPMHPEAIPAAEAAECAGEQGAYWKYHDALFSQKNGLNRAAYDQYATDLGLDSKAFTACLDSHRYQAEIQADASDAARVGISGTPSFVVNGRILIGALPFSEFKTVIDEELAAKP